MSEIAGLQRRSVDLNNRITLITYAAVWIRANKRFDAEQRILELEAKLESCESTLGMPDMVIDYQRNSRSNNVEQYSGADEPVQDGASATDK